MYDKNKERIRGIDELITNTRTKENQGKENEGRTEGEQHKEACTRISSVN